MSELFETRNISIANLLIDEENARYLDPVKSQKEAILKMMEIKGDTIVELAKSILELGFIPHEVPLVCPDEKNSGFYIVKEGNRRVTALKLLSEPAIIAEEYPHYRDQFLELQKEYGKQLFTDIPCCVSSDLEKIYTIIELRHTGENKGRGLVRWDSNQQKAFMEKRGKKTLFVLALSYLQTLDILSDTTKERLRTVAVTNLERLISDPYVRENTGMQYHSGSFSINLDDPVKKYVLLKIIDALTAKSPLKVEVIYNKERRAKFIDEIKASYRISSGTSSTNPEVPKEKDLIHTGNGATNSDNLRNPPNVSDTSPTFESEKNSNTSGKRKQTSQTSSNTKKRKTIIPENCEMVIDKPRLVKLYGELKHLDVVTYPNAGAVTLRVFIELSVDHYLEILNITPPKNSLHQKVKAIEADLKTRGVETKNITKGIKVLSDKEYEDEHGSTNTLNACVHNIEYTPSGTDIMTAWENIQEFMKKIHEIIIAEEK